MITLDIVLERWNQILNEQNETPETQFAEGMIIGFKDALEMCIHDINLYLKIKNSWQVTNKQVKCSQRNNFDIYNKESDKNEPIK